MGDALDYDQWDTLTHDQQIVLAEHVERFLAPRLRFAGLEPFIQGDASHTIAMFEAEVGRFALLPGYHGSLGYDAARFANTPFSREALSDSIGPHLKHPDQVGAYLDEVLTPLRQVTLAPFLIATTTQPLEHVEYIPGVAKHYLRRVARQEVLDLVTEEGYRLPTDDEWEYACSGGTKSFFRWGNMLPPLYWSPTSMRHADEWREDLMPNAFGLLIGQDPWHLEYCAEENVMRGGDGGTADSIQISLEVEWLPFATNYRRPFNTFANDNLLTAYIRRALSLPDALLDEPVM